MLEEEAGMPHKLTGREVFDAPREKWRNDPGKDKAGEVCFDALAPRLNESTVNNGNHDAVVRAITGED